MGALVEGSQAAAVEAIILDVEGVKVEALHARPAGVPLGGVVVVPDIGGLRPLYEDLCRRLASHGLAVCAVETFSRVAAGSGPLDLDARRARAGELYDDLVLEDLAEAADHLAAADHVGTVSVMGFCLGGSYALKAAASGRFERAVAFYGLIRTLSLWTGGGQRDALDVAAGACPTLAIFGEVDPYTPAADIDALRNAWAGRPDHKVIVYPGADHAFAHDPDRPEHRAGDAADAWRKALAFLLD
jgi:carboxymethylenebutenolidase